MAINRNTPATVLVSGYVDRINEARTGEAKGRRVYAHDLTIETEGGGKLAARIWLRPGQDEIPVPTVGEFVAFLAAVSERRDQDGTLRAELHVQRPVHPGDVDKLHSSLGSAALAAK